jgi:hypothetical protein
VPAAFLLLALVVVAFWYLSVGPGNSTIVIVNRTTVPVSAEDSGSRRIVGPCSERTIEYHGTWGGDTETSVPVAEPLPSGASRVSLESRFTRPFERAVHLRVLVDTHGSQTVASDRDLRAEPCAGQPRTGVVTRQ